MVAPFVLKIDDDSTAGKTSRVCHIDLWFVAYADLARISDEKFVRQQFEAETAADGNGSSSQLVALSPADLIIWPGILPRQPTRRSSPARSICSIAPV